MECFCSAYQGHCGPECSHQVPLKGPLGTQSGSHHQLPPAVLRPTERRATACVSSGLGAVGRTDLPLRAPRAKHSIQERGAILLHQCDVSATSKPVKAGPDTPGLATTRSSWTAWDPQHGQGQALPQWVPFLVSPGSSRHALRAQPPTDTAGGRSAGKVA